jgi:Effector Associated Constant Component 1
MTGDLVLIEVDPGSSRFAKGSEKWLSEREELRSDLERGLGPGAVLEGSPEPGSKGLALIPIVAALGGAHAFQALARCFEAWLKYRPGERSLTMTATIDGKKVSVQVNASNMSLDVLQPFFQGLGDALKQGLGDAPQ